MSVPCRSEKVFPGDGVDVLFKRLARVFGRAAFERVDDPQVGGSRELPPLRVAQFRRTALRVDGVEAFHGGDEQPVARAFREGLVEPGVELAGVLPGEPAALRVAGDGVCRRAASSAMEGSTMRRYSVTSSNIRPSESTASRMAILRGSMSGTRT